MPRRWPVSQCNCMWVNPLGTQIYNSQTFEPPAFPWGFLFAALLLLALAACGGNGGSSGPSALAGAVSTKGHRGSSPRSAQVLATPAKYGPTTVPWIAGGGSRVPEGEFASASADKKHSCGVRTDGTVICWGSNMGLFDEYAGQAMPPEGEFVSVSSVLLLTCGVRTDYSVVYRGNDGDDGKATPPRGSWSRSARGEFTPAWCGPAVPSNIGAILKRSYQQGDRGRVFTSQ